MSRSPSSYAFGGENEGLPELGEAAAEETALRGGAGELQGPLVGHDHSLELLTRAEGCTPGFWKNHPAQWGVTGFTPNQRLESVFDVPDSHGLDSSTLLQALSFQGGNNTTGAARNLLRAGVAALLDSARPGVEYPRSTADVISSVNAALASGNRATMLALASQLDADNNLGCPLS